jgi:hypothetical protein
MMTSTEQKQSEDRLPQDLANGGKTDEDEDEDRTRSQKDFGSESA